VLHNENCTVSCELLIAAIENQRLSLQRAGQQALAALRGQDPELRRIHAEITKKQRAIASFRRGLEHNPGLQAQIDAIEQDVAGLKARREELGRKSVTSRFDGLPPEARKKALEQEQQELAALGTKDTSAIFACMVLETLGDTPVTERDSEFIKEVASHLQHPFETVHRMADLDSLGRPRREENRALLRYIDKREDLMTMVRCADSKICCFTSSNYEMQVAHQTPNRYWVASLLADPLSFCFSIERPGGDEAVGDQRNRRQNIGFVFGTFGLVDDQPVLCLNGVYLSTGGDARAVESVLNEIEHGFARPLGLKAILLGSQHGGSIRGDLGGYSMEVNTVLRLRALADPSGNIETRIYDDFSQIVNTPIELSRLVKWLS
jgi:hypothetical protein